MHAAFEDVESDRGKFKIINMLLTFDLDASFTPRNRRSRQAGTPGHKEVTCGP